MSTSCCSNKANTISLFRDGIRVGKPSREGLCPADTLRVFSSPLLIFRICDFKASSLTELHPEVNRSARGRR